MIAEVELGAQSLFGKGTRHLFVGEQRLQKVSVSLPHLNGVALHESVGILPSDTSLDQSQQHPLRMDQTTKAIEIGTHPLRINHETLDQLGEADKREIERDGGVRPDYPLDRGVGDVALMPKRYVLERRERIAADETR